MIRATPDHWMNWGQLLESLRTATVGLSGALGDRHLLTTETGNALWEVVSELEKVQKKAWNEYQDQLYGSEPEVPEKKKRGRSRKK